MQSLEAVRSTLGSIDSPPECQWRQRFHFCDWPEVEGVDLQFRLIYEGRLPAAGTDNRTADKHRIRQQIHKQLAQFYQHDPFLKSRSKTSIQHSSGRAISILEAQAENFSRCGYRFVPLINNSEGLACSLDILFMRRDRPGNLVKSGGDIDNRLKVLFDALRMPQGCNELFGFEVPGAGEDPFFCLMEDDSLITDVSVVTDTLLYPVGENEGIHHVHLVIHVKVRVLDSTKAVPAYWAS
jgi:hypothetical protein